MIANNRLGFSTIEQSVRHRCIASHSSDAAIADSADALVSSMAALLHRDRLKAWW